MKRASYIKKLLAQVAQEVDVMYTLETAKTERRKKRMEQKLTILKDMIVKGKKE